MRNDPAELDIRISINNMVMYCIVAGYSLIPMLMG